MASAFRLLSESFYKERLILLIVGADAPARAKPLRIRSERIVTRRGLHGDPAQIGKFRDSRLAAEVTEPAALDATKRHLRLVVYRRAVDVADARLNAPGNIHRARDVPAEHR